MQKFTVLILVIFLMFCNAFAKENKETIRKPSKFKEKLKETFKSDNKKLEEINETSLQPAIDFINSMSIKYVNVTYSADDLIIYTKKREDEINKLEKRYRSNPSNIKNNQEFIKILAKYGVHISSINEGIEKDILQEAHNIYLNKHANQVKERMYTWIKAFSLSGDAHAQMNFQDEISSSRYNFNSFVEALKDNKMVQVYKRNKELQPIWYQLAEEVSTYSYNYEKTKYNNWAVKNNKKIAIGAMEYVVYNTIYSSTPQTNIIYKHAPRGHLWLRVQQSVPGGVILTGDSRMGTYNYNQVFLQTSRNFADNQLIDQGFMAEFKGYYEYTTVLGARRKIYKFKELSDKEIKSNFEIPGQPFYFYQPY